MRGSIGAGTSGALARARPSSRGSGTTTFSHGPSAGTRAPSDAVTEVGEERDVYDVLDRRGFNLVLFDDPERTGARLRPCARRTRWRTLGDEVQTLVV